MLDRGFYDSFDELNSYVIDEDKILDHLEPLISKEDELNMLV